jgi:hypothetical protein
MRIEIFNIISQKFIKKKSNQMLKHHFDNLNVELYRFIHTQFYLKYQFDQFKDFVFEKFHSHWAE